MLCSRASEAAPRTRKIRGTLRACLRFSRSAEQRRTYASTACTVRRADEQCCARPPESIKMRNPSTPKVAPLSSLVAVPYLVSLSALACNPTALLLIVRDPALAVVLRTAVARQGDLANACAARRSCPRAHGRCCGRGSAMYEPRRCSAGRAASRLIEPCDRRTAWSGCGPR